MVLSVHRACRPVPRAFVPSCFFAPFHSAFYHSARNTSIMGKRFTARLAGIVANPATMSISTTVPSPTNGAGTFSSVLCFPMQTLLPQFSSVQRDLSETDHTGSPERPLRNGERGLLCFWFAKKNGGMKRNREVNWQRK